MKKSVELPDSSLFSFKDEQGSKKPIVMVNLLRFRERAQYADASVSCSGQQAYTKYSKAVVPLILEVGGFPVWAGRVRSSLIADDGEQWDQVALVAYPSRKAFVDMHLSQAYIDCVVHRNASLADVKLIETTAIYFPLLLVRIVGLFFRIKTFFMPREAIKSQSKSS